jgi:SAM-dependent methyltransferase
MKKTFKISPTSINLLERSMEQYVGTKKSMAIAAKRQLDMERIEDRFSDIRKYIKSDDRNFRLLEIGSGVGAFLAYLKKNKINAYGLEPDEKAFKAAELLLENNEIDKCIKHGFGEKIPYADNFFDIVISFQVLEHARDPFRVIQESARVLKDKGFIYFVIPNYKSFWEGHYGIPWFPWFNKSLAKIYVKLLRRNADFIDSVNFITPNKLKFWAEKSGLALISMGEKTFYKNLLESEIKGYWSSNKFLGNVVRMIRKTMVASLIAYIATQLEFYYPIVFLAQKINSSTR